VSALCGFLPSSKMFPMMGNGYGPGGSLVEFWVCLTFLRIKMRMLALAKVTTSRSVWWFMAFLFLREVVHGLLLLPFPLVI